MADEVHVNTSLIELNTMNEPHSNGTKTNGDSTLVSFHDSNQISQLESGLSISKEPDRQKEDNPSISEGSLSRQHQQALKLHGRPRELPGSIYHILRFTDDWREVARWTASRERRQHVDDYRCKSYISFTESVGNLTALLLACLYNRPKAIQVLLEAGADVGMKDDLGRSALHCLCASKSEKSIYEAFKMIMDRVLSKPPECISALVNGKERNYGRTAVMDASLASRDNAIILLCKSNLNADLKLSDDEGKTALHYICYSKTDSVDPNALTTMIEMSDVNARDIQGRTPFLVACENNKAEIAKRLLDAGTDLFVEDNDKRNALHYLSASENENITEILGIISKKFAEKARFSRELRGFESPDSVELLSSTDGIIATAREFINKTDSHGMTPLQIALKKEHIENAKILIANGADIDIRLDDGRLPLQYACDSKKPHVDLAIDLVKHGANITIRLEEGTALNRYSCSLLHFACREDYVDLVDCLLQNGADVMDRDTENKRPFYYVQSYNIHKLLVKAGGIDTREREPRLLDESCRKGLSDKAIYLIEHVKDVKPKHLKDAIKYNYQSIAMALVKHPNWYKFLRHTFFGDHCEQTTPFRELIKKMPDVAEIVLDRCMVSDPKFKDPGDSNFSVIMNYEFLEDFSLPQQTSHEESDDVMKAHLSLGKQFKSDDLELPEYVGHDCSYEALNNVKQKCFHTKWGPVGFRKRSHPLSIMVLHRRSNLLSHPLVESLLHYKWNKFGRYGYYGNLVVYCIFLIFLTAYSLVLPNPLSDTCQEANVTKNIGNRDFVKDCALGKPRELFLYTAAIVVIIISILRTTFDTFQLIGSYSHGSLIFLAFKFALHLFSIIFAFFFFNKPCGCLFFWQWELGVMATFMAWMNLVFFVSKFPHLGIYVIMFSRVFYTFLKVVLLFSLLVIAFAISFFMAFSEPQITRSPFSTPARALLKTITMTAGEFEFDEIFRQAPNGDSDDENEIKFEWVSTVLWITFVVVMPVLLTNMLVGLAVGDIDLIQKGAALKKLALQVNLVLAVESALRKRPFRKILTVAWKKIWPNSVVTTKDTFEVLKWSKKRLQVEKLWSQIQFAEWGGVRYDSLKHFSKGLSSSKDHQCDQSEISFERTHFLAAEVEKIHQQLKHVQAQNEALIEIVKDSQDELKKTLIQDMVTLLTKNANEASSQSPVPALLDSEEVQEVAQATRLPVPAIFGHAED